jgi:hypothetical protein
MGGGGAQRRDDDDALGVRELAKFLGPLAVVPRGPRLELIGNCGDERG